MRPALRGAAALALAFAPAAVRAGPPFLTDDPEPTETGHWEIYAPAFEAEGQGRAHAGSLGAEFNYGAAPELQLTVGLPVAYAHDAAGTRTGAGDVELSAKYRFLHDEAAGLSVAVFPGISVPTARRGLGDRHVTGLLPVWGQKDFGEWSVFGGGGYEINPGAGARNAWTGGVALTRQVSDRLLLGVEADRTGSEAVSEPATTSLGLGAILALGGPYRLLASAGPTFRDGGGKADFHLFVALGIDF